MLSDEEIGQRIGQVIAALVDLIAEVDGVTRNEVLEVLFEEWWVNRIADQAEN